MKVSKVNHTHAAVKDQGGILYETPAIEGRSKTLEERFDELNGNAKRLYKVFNPATKSKKKEQKTYQVFLDGTDGKSGLNGTLKRVLFYYKRDEGTQVTSLYWLLKKLPETKSVDQDLLDDCFTMYLRKSLKKETEGLRTLISLFGTDGRSRISEEERAAIERFLECLKKDYYKNAQKESVVKSIQNQNLPVQPKACGKEGGQEEENLFLLSYGSIETKNSKQGRKEGLRSFLNDYADLSEEHRMDTLRRLRRLIDLYFHVPDQVGGKDGGSLVIPEELLVRPQEVDASPSFNVWEKHESGKDDDRDFVTQTDLIRKMGSGNEKDTVQVKKEREQLQRQIRRRNWECYRFCCELIKKDGEEALFFEDPAINDFWIDHIKSATERILKSVNEKNLFKLKIGYLCEKVWKDVLNYISIKYIAIGKAVYQFGMDDLWLDMETGQKNTDGQANDMLLGIVPESVTKGITSFDYEQIKANETLQRELAVAVAFASNNLSRATVSLEKAAEQELEKAASEKKYKPRDMSDFLIWNDNDIANCRLNENDGETLKAILQFFGGYSTWKEQAADEQQHSFAAALKDTYKEKYEARFLSDLKKIIYALRNESFHFTTANKNPAGWNQELIGMMFEKEASYCLDYEKEKFCSNNLPLFYESDDLKRLLDCLYRAYQPRGSQIPSFQKVLVRDHFQEFLSEAFPGIAIPADPDTAKKWRSAVYYAFKEIYYNAFLASETNDNPQQNIRKLFFAAVEKDVEDHSYDKRSKEAWAVRSFSERCEEINERSFSEICQIIMMEYASQNAGNRKVKSAGAEKKDPAIFQHYKMLLPKYIREAFASYIKNNDQFAFLIKKDQELYDSISPQEFLPGWTSGKYKTLIDEVKEDADLQKWYIVSHFLDGRMLNLLAGTLRSYVQFIGDIRRRAEETGTELVKDHENDKNVERIRKAVQVVDFCVRLNSRFTKEFSDYFPEPAKEEYAKYLGCYIDYAESDSPWGEKLNDFCNNHGMEQGVYMDEKNPIPNRNVMMAKLFGPESILRCLPKITASDLKYLNEAKTKIQDYLVTGKCKTQEMQKAVLYYQRRKNQVELRDKVEYSELINELLGQLVNWSYLRERDLLYFQLGFHYMCLNNPEASDIPEEGYRMIRREDGSVIKGAVLYQIAAMYINGIRMYSKDKILDGNLGTGSKLGIFCRYYSDTVYLAGLEVFENTNEHDYITDLRNYIDHFKYYNDQENSILELYSKVFDNFFTYDMKYQKTVITMLQNILLRHCVILKPAIGSGKKNVGMKQEKWKKSALIEIADNGLSSDVYTYKLETGTLKTPARDEAFLNNIAALLCYPQKKPEGKIYLKKDSFQSKKKKNTKQEEKNTVIDHDAIKEIKTKR